MRYLTHKQKQTESSERKKERRNMLAITKTAGLSGICGMEVTVEASAERGLPAYHVIGLGDTAVKESAERVRGAILNSGFA